MNNLDYEKAGDAAREGIDRAIDGKMYRSVIIHKENMLKVPNFSIDECFFKGNLLEIAAYVKLDKKSFLELTREHFLEVASLFDDAVEALAKACYTPRDRATLTSIPKAWSNLLKFTANPNLEGLEYLAQFEEQLESSHLIKRQFAPTRIPERKSKRRQKAAAMGDYYRKNVIKVGCWNIFSELHQHVNIVETSINNKRGYKEFLQKKLRSTKISQERLECYDGEKNLTYDRIIDDIQNYLPHLFPLGIRASAKNSSLVITKDLYSFIKHEKIFTKSDLYRKEEFAENLMKKILKNYKILLTLNLDRERFLEKIRKGALVSK